MLMLFLSLFHLYNMISFHFIVFFFFFHFNSLVVTLPFFSGAFLFLILLLLLSLSYFYNITTCYSTMHFTFCRHHCSFLVKLCRNRFKMKIIKPLDNEQKKKKKKQFIQIFLAHFPFEWLWIVYMCGAVLCFFFLVRWLHKIEIGRIFWRSFFIRCSHYCCCCCCCRRRLISTHRYLLGNVHLLTV